VEACILAAMDKNKDDNLEASLDGSDSSGGDILNRLIMAWSRDDKYRLTQRDVLANSLSLMFAGHGEYTVSISANFHYI